MKHPTNPPLGTLFWFIHHGQPIEALTEPLANRRRYIRTNKPKNEVATRLKWLRVVKHPEKLPKRFLTDMAKVGALWGIGTVLRFKGNALRAKANALRVKSNALRANADALWDKGDALRANADALWDRAYALRDKGNALRAATLAKHREAIHALHREECPGCPCDYEKGELIFPTP